MSARLDGPRLLSHFFGGGFPLFPFVLLAFAFLMLRRRRRPRY